MFAQLIRAGTPPERRAELDRLVREELLPALEDEPGFAGALSLVDGESGEAAMTIVLWETREQAALPMSERRTTVRQALAGIARMSIGQRAPVSLWQVTAEV